ncbi:SH3 domain-containing protein [uncultured Aquimarina sp.]|uniref:SH3 domain-containing protein n=1 Tax=uncultured Aquimarina sp. TaxID=575652 RepID=UPI00263014F0|nr:SH3 domain-containing protein [uncultured Aquimarina sp.]
MKQVVLIVLILSCSSISYSQNQLFIEGKNIWVRETPVDGKVLMKLNTGDTCLVLGKSNEQVIKGNKDFWYQIEHNGEIGWVFGSQTSIRQKAAINNFEPFLKYFLTTSFFGKRINSLIKVKSHHINPFVKKEIGVYRFFNPGSACVLASFESYIPVHPKIDFLSIYKNESPKNGFCDESKDPDGVYYSEIDKLPTYADIEKGGSERINIPAKYRNGSKIKVDILKDEWIVKTMYFIIADHKWWLVLIDDCDCSA